MQSIGWKCPIESAAVCNLRFEARIPDCVASYEYLASQRQVRKVCSDGASAWLRIPFFCGGCALKCEIGVLLWQRIYQVAL